MNISSRAVARLCIMRRNFEMLKTLVRHLFRFSPPLLCALAVAAVCASACVAPPDEIGKQQGAVLDICATAPEGALCDDKNVCTVFDVCKSGVCKGSSAPNGTLCTDGNVCTANDSCRAGTCMGDPVPDTTACTDGDPCTVGDACHSGFCVPGAGTMSCNDGIACTMDSCVAGTGCVFTPVGDCSMPKDAGPEASMMDASPETSPDASPMPDAHNDVMSGDVASDGPATSDGPGADAPRDTAPIDVGGMETAPPEPPEDGSTQTMPDAGVDAVVDVDAPVASDAADAADRPTDAAVDAADAAIDMGSPPPVMLPLLRASGGACAVATTEVPRGGWSLFALGFVTLLARRRGRTRPRA
jgi:MYXO-CTERM domain-containing protein